MILQSHQEKKSDKRKGRTQDPENVECSHIKCHKHKLHPMYRRQYPGTAGWSAGKNINFKALNSAILPQPAKIIAMYGLTR